MASELTPTDVVRLERARRAYELSRMRAALVWALPTIAISVVAWMVDQDPRPALLAGPLLFAATWFFLWRGKDLGRSVIPGIAAGALPFLAMHLARLNGHVCNGALCFTACLPATFAAAAVAGVAIASRARRSGAPITSWTSAGVVAVLTGALGCSCVGLGGIAGLVAGLLVGAAPVALRPRAAVQP